MASTIKEELLSKIENSLKVTDVNIEIIDEGKLREESIDILIYDALLGSDDVKSTARRIIREVSGKLGITLASIQGLYEAYGRSEVSGYTVPAINIRGLTYDVSRALFRTMEKNKSNSLLFEIAKSEIGYTLQRPDEYTVNMLAAAIKENYSGPVFIQGDHFQVNAKKYNVDNEAEISSLKELIKEAIEAGFYNIDIDASTLVDLSLETVYEQQRPNFEVTADLTDYIREIEPEGITVSVGGEIGEVGSTNTTEEELREFMKGYKECLKSDIGISKLSIQTGTAHGGIPLADGTIAKANVDFDTIKKLSNVAVKDYGLSGVVQHGASTLPDEAFHHFPQCGASEIHLATGFQNMIYASEALPKELLTKIDNYIMTDLVSEKKDTDTDEQFVYKTRKKGFGPFKKEFMDLSDDIKNKIGKELEDRFDFLFKKLEVVNRRADVDKYVK